jgi:hypothetical protein
MRGYRYQPLRDSSGSLAMRWRSAQIFASHSRRARFLGDVKHAIVGDAHSFRRKLNGNDSHH